MGQRAALYCRVSTADQSCERQERDLLAFAQEMLGRLRPVLGLPPIARPLARLARIVRPMFGPLDMGKEA